MCINHLMKSFWSYGWDKLLLLLHRLPSIHIKYRINYRWEIGRNSKHESALSGYFFNWHDHDRQYNYWQFRRTHAIVVVYFYWKRIIVFYIFCCATWLKLTQQISLLWGQRDHDFIFFFETWYLKANGTQIYWENIFVYVRISCYNSTVMDLN